jgi:uncharacterized damage-inducible protein DinB
MTPPTADQAALILSVAYLPQITAEHALTKAVIAAIPAENADYRPDAIVKSARELAWHIVSAEIRFLEGCESGSFDYGHTSPPETVRTPADIVAWYADRFAAAVGRLRTIPAEHLLRVVDFRGVLQLPAYVYVAIGMNHTVHHRGQLSMYLRPMGAKVPSIYGESYDAREAREQGQPTSASVTNPQELRA